MSSGEKESPHERMKSQQPGDAFAKAHPNFVAHTSDSFDAGMKSAQLAGSSHATPVLAKAVASALKTEDSTQISTSEAPAGGVNLVFDTPAASNSFADHSGDSPDPSTAYPFPTGYLDEGEPSKAYPFPTGNARPLMVTDARNDESWDGNRADKLAVEDDAKAFARLALMRSFDPPPSSWGIWKLGGGQVVLYAVDSSACRKTQGRAAHT